MGKKLVGMVAFKHVTCSEPTIAIIFLFCTIDGPISLELEMKALSTVELGDYPLELRLCGIETTQFRRTGEKGGCATADYMG